MNLTHSELVERAERWLRGSARIHNPGYAGGRRVQCGVVLTEYVSACSEIPDAIGWFLCGRFSILVECKATRSDFLADKKKLFRDKQFAATGVGMYRYYLTNPGVAKIEELPEKWGLLEISGRQTIASMLAEQQERNVVNEMGLLWSECRKIQIVERGGELRQTRAGSIVTEKVIAMREENSCAEQ